MFKFKQAILVFLFLWIGIQAYAQNNSEVDQGRGKSAISMGEKIDLENLLSAYQMEKEYRNLKAGDTLQSTFAAQVTSVCKNKGCWMKVALEDGSEVMVKFKDYAFFVPKDIETSTVFINGLAYVEEMSVEEQKHYAEDEGLSREEISAIKVPKKTLLFLADGVRIEK